MYGIETQSECSVLVKDTDYWSTPAEIVRAIGIFCGRHDLTSTATFDIDVCANEYNKRCERFISEDENALKTDWIGKLAWCNPPYSRGNVDCFVNRAIEQYEAHGTETVMLLNVDCSTKWFATVVEKAKAIIYITQGRISFVDATTGVVGGKPSKPNMFVVFGKRGSFGLATYYVGLPTLYTKWSV